MNQVYFQTQNRKSTKRMIFTGCCCCYFPGLVGIDVRMIFCLIFKWFTLFSCKLSRNKLVLIPLSTVLHLPLLFTSLFSWLPTNFTLHFLFAFHFNTLKHFFSFAIISCKQLLLLDSSHVTTTLLFCFCFYNLLLLPLQECEVQWLWMFFILFSFILLVWVWMCLVSFLLAIFFLFLF